MRKYRHFIICLLLFMNANFLLSQEAYISNKDLFRKQINELKEQKNFIKESACPIRKEEVKQYQINVEKLQEILGIADLVFNTPQSLKKGSIKEQKDNTISYQSSNIPNVIIKRHSSRISMSDLVSDNSSSVSASRLFTESFTLDRIEIKAHYRVNKKSIVLISLDAVYPNKDRVYINRSTAKQADFRVYNSTEYGTEFKNIQIYFDPFNIGKINYLETKSYQLYLEEYYEAVKDVAHQKIKKTRYAIRCYDDDRQLIIPAKTGNSIDIKPTTHLLWYKGFIGKYPIKMMLKRGYNEETDDERVLGIAYGYDSQQKWIHLQSFWEPQAGIFGYEENDDSPKWSVVYENNKVLKGEWDNQNGTILPITLTPMAKIFSDITFKVQIEDQLTPSGDVASKIAKGLKVFRNQEEIQYLEFNEGYSLDYLDLAYVDINYDGYLDLVINNNFYLYKVPTKTFEAYESEEYFPYLTKLSQYNLFTKSYIAQHNRSMIEYRAINGDVTPYHASSYYPNEEGDIVMLEQRFKNGKWITIEERIETMEEESFSDEVDITSSENYGLAVDLTIQDGRLYFTPIFYNKTGVELSFQQKSRLIVVLRDENQNIREQFLYDVTLGSEKEQLLDDAAILSNGENHFLDTSIGLLPFFSLDLKKGQYTFCLKLEQPLFGEVYSREQKITIPLAIEKEAKLKHLTGTINSVVNGDLYLVMRESAIKGFFVNTKTKQRIKVAGKLETGFFGYDTLNLEEYEKEDKLSGYFEGEYKNGIYQGYWLSPTKKTKVPFEFKKIDK